MARDDILLEDEIAEYIDTEKGLERLDRRLRMRKALSISIVSVLLCCLVIYAAIIERKISLLSQQTPVVIYMNGETTVDAEETTSAVEEDTVTDFDKTTTDTETTVNDATKMNEETTANTDISNTAVNNLTDEKEIVEETTELSPAPSESISSAYYVTKTGTKYHTNGCSHLSKSKIPMSYDEIVAKGYKPCSKCIS